MADNALKNSSAKSYIILIAAIAVIYAFFHIAGIGCPIKFLTGISCAGCGMTRAFFCVLKADFKTAFHYHLLWPLVPPFAALILFRGKINKKLFKITAAFIITTFIAVYIIRLLSPNDSVVTIDISQSAMLKLINSIIK